MTSDPMRGTNEGAYLCAVAACLCLVLGMNLWLIANYGNNTPFWDQWAEPISIYRPYLNGTFDLSDLFAFHNEHRLVFTRLSAFALFLATKHWDPTLQTIWNALLHAATIGFLIVALLRPTARAGQLIFPGLVAAVFIAPFAWQNVLYGFHSQYYFLILLGSTGLFLLCTSAAWTLRWCVGTLLAAASYLTVAPGALTLVAFLALAVLQLIVGQRRGPAELAGLAAQVILVVIMIADIPRPEHHAVAKPTTLMEFFDALATLASWPVAKASWSLTARALTALLIEAPAIVLAVRLLREGPPITDARWFMVLVAGWGVLLLLATSYGRGALALHSRYYDLFLIGLVANGAALMHLAFAHVQGARARFVRLAAVIWVTTLCLGIGHKAGAIPAELEERRVQAAAQTHNVMQYLASGDIAALENKPPFHIPFPDAKLLADLLSDPVIRSVLPPALFGKPDRTGAVGFILRNGLILIPAGLALFLIAAMTAAMGLSAGND